MEQVKDILIGREAEIKHFDVLLSGKTPKSIKSLPIIYMDMREKHASCPFFGGMGTIKKNSSDFRGKQDL